MNHLLVVLLTIVLVGCSTPASVLAPENQEKPSNCRATYGRFDTDKLRADLEHQRRTDQLWNETIIKRLAFLLDCYYSESATAIEPKE